MISEKDKIESYLSPKKNYQLVVIVLNTGYYIVLVSNLVGGDI